MQNNFKFGDIIIHQEKGRGVVVATFLNSIDVVFDGDRKIKTLSLKCEKVTVEHQDKWVSVKDQLPQDNELVLVYGRITSDDGTPCKPEYWTELDFRQDDIWQNTHDLYANAKFNVLFWQSLPTPPTHLE